MGGEKKWEGRKEAEGEVRGRVNHEGRNEGGHRGNVMRKGREGGFNKRERS